MFMFALCAISTIKQVLLPYLSVTHWEMHFSGHTIIL